MGIDLNQLRSEAPLLFAQLAEDAQEEDITPAEYLNSVVDGDEYVRDTLAWCQAELKKVDQFKQITGLIPTAVDKLSCPLANSGLFSKYQMTLDNQTYKAMKALREAQEWRLKTIEVEPPIEASNAA